MTELLPNLDLRIEAYDFGEFLAEFQAAVLEGFELDLEDNDRIPQKYGSHLSVVLKKSASVDSLVEDEVTEDTSQKEAVIIASREQAQNALNEQTLVEAKAKPGRKPKATSQPTTEQIDAALAETPEGS